MWHYIVRRLLQAIAVVLLVSVIVFVLLKLLPGGTARAILGQTATPEQIADFNRAEGYDRPIPIQYLSYLGRLVRGDLGYSYQQNRSVASLLALRLPKSLLLTVVSTALAVVVAIPLGLLQAVRRNRAIDHIVTGVSFVLYGTPVYFLGLVLIIVFSEGLHWFPPAAPQAATMLGILGDPRALVLPVVALTLVSVAAYSRYARSAVLDNMYADYVRTARAKGASEKRVLLRHVVRNALVPVLTLFGAYIPLLFSGSLVIEAIFNYPGAGLLFWQAAQTRDYPVLLGITLVVAVVTVLGSVAVDLLYAVLDPRVRYVRV